MTDTMEKPVEAPVSEFTTFQLDGVDIERIGFHGIREAALVHGTKNLRVFMPAAVLQRFGPLAFTVSTNGEDDREVVECRIIEGRFNRDLIRDNFKILIVPLERNRAYEDMYVMDVDSYLRENLDDWYVMVADKRLKFDIFFSEFIRVEDNAKRATVREGDIVRVRLHSVELAEEHPKRAVNEVNKMVRVTRVEENDGRAPSEFFYEDDSGNEHSCSVLFIEEFWFKAVDKPKDWITNFNLNQMHVYECAIREAQMEGKLAIWHLPMPNETIDPIDCDWETGNTYYRAESLVNKCGSLICYLPRSQDLSDFWRVFDKVKARLK